MKDSLQMKLRDLCDRHEELAALMSQPDIINDQTKFREYSQEYAELGDVVNCFNQWQTEQENLSAAEAMLADADPDMQEMGAEESAAIKERLVDLEDELQRLMLPRDPRDKSNVFLEVRAGTGGDEAAIFAGDLLRMYSRYADSQGWRIEMVSGSEGEHGGYKEVICRVIGEGAYSRLKFESGAHRVQRVPATESQGRVHTSACTVAIMAEAEEVEDVEVRNEDLRIDTFRASGAGGQHVNTTDSAVRITHLPTGLVVECQEERSQHSNKAKAMVLLRSRLLDSIQQQQQQELAATRKSLVGSGDRSERIRTYNFPQGRLTDHRINLTLYKLAEAMEGDIGDILDALQAEHQAEQLAAMSAEH